MTSSGENLHRKTIIKNRHSHTLQNGKIYVHGLI